MFYLLSANIYMQLQLNCCSYITCIACSCVKEDSRCMTEGVFNFQKACCSVMHKVWEVKKHITLRKCQLNKIH